MPRSPLDPVVLSPGGSGRRAVPIGQVTIPDVWHLIEYLKRKGMTLEADEVTTLWHLAHDLKKNLDGTIPEQADG